MFNTETNKYNGYGTNKEDAYIRAFRKAFHNNEPDSVLDMILDCHSQLKGENDFIHWVEVEYLLYRSDENGEWWDCTISVGDC